MKQYLATDLLVTAPLPEAPLLLYVSASDRAVSAVLVHESVQLHKTVQQQVYYLSEALSGAKLNYSEIKKIAYAVLISTRKLKHYFQAHEVIVPRRIPSATSLETKKHQGE